ncbi:MAG: DUF2225 domain-containing protein [Spirochaetia bacterium]|nr:DUF2225 domain-containing protein [Spirochaetia bacterium]
MPDPIWLKDVKCPACDTAFKTARIKSSALKAKSMDSDFHKIYEGIRPLLYAVTVCPKCNFGQRNDDFDRVKLEYHPEIMNIAMAIRDSGKNIQFPDSREIDTETAVKKHQLAITFYKHWKPEDPLMIAGLYMHIAWMYREDGAKEREKEFIKHAHEYYIKTFEKGTHIPEKIGEPGIMYLIGELYRMQGDFVNAVNWFSRTVKHEIIGNFPNIESLTRDAWEKINEQKHKTNGS